MKSQCVLILDFGGQYKELIARRVRECNVYSLVRSGDISAREVRELAPIGIILTGGPNSVYLEESPHCDPEIFELGIPVLGICYGCQLLAHHLGGKVVPAADASAREYGKTETFFDISCTLFRGLPEKGISWMTTEIIWKRCLKALRWRRIPMPAPMWPFVMKYAAFTACSFIPR